MDTYHVSSVWYVSNFVSYLYQKKKIGTDDSCSSAFPSPLLTQVSLFHCQMNEWLKSNIKHYWQVQTNKKKIHRLHSVYQKFKIIFTYRKVWYTFFAHYRAHIYAHAISIRPSMWDILSYYNLLSLNRPTIYTHYVVVVICSLQYHM